MGGYYIRYYDEQSFPVEDRSKLDEEFIPILKLALHHAPHKRMHRKTLQYYREDLLYVAQRSISDKVDLPIGHPIDLEVLFTNPTSPDLDHLIEAVFMALDGKSLKGPSILKDDRLIQKVTMSKFYHSRARRDTQD